MKEISNKTTKKGKERKNTRTGIFLKAYLKWELAKVGFSKKMMGRKSK